MYFDLDFGVSAFACGWFLYVLSADLHRKEAYRELTPLFFTLGSGLMLAGVSYHVGGTIYEPLALSLGFGFLMHAVLTGSRTLYVVSLLYVAGYFLDGFGGRWWGWAPYQRHHYEVTAMVTGASLVLAGHWLGQAAFISASPVWLFSGTAFALGGAYHLLYDTAAAPIFAGIATLAIYAALALRSRAMLAAAILGLLGFMVDYSQRHFARNLSWPLLLILFGFVVLLSRRRVRPPVGPHQGAGERRGGVLRLAQKSAVRDGSRTAPGQVLTGGRPPSPRALWPIALSPWPAISSARSRTARSA